MTFLEHCLQFFCIRFHLCVEFFFADVYILNLYVKILACAKHIAFFLELIIYFTNKVFIFTCMT